MVTIKGLLQRAYEVGFEISIEGEKLKIKGAKRFNSLAMSILDRKSEIIEELNASRSSETLKPLIHRESKPTTNLSRSYGEQNPTRPKSLSKEKISDEERASIKAQINQCRSQSKSLTKYLQKGQTRILERYIIERREILQTLDESKIRKWLHSYRMRWPYGKSFWIRVHEWRARPLVGLTVDERDRSAQWLKSNKNPKHLKSKQS